MANDNGSGGRDRYARPPQPASPREKASERFEKPANWDDERTTPEQRIEWLRRRAKGDHQ